MRLPTRSKAARRYFQMGVSPSTVNWAHMAYDGGLEALKPRPSGGRKRENMSLREEKALLARFAKAAGAGEMLNIHDLKAAYEKTISQRTRVSQSSSMPQCAVIPLPKRRRIFNVSCRSTSSKTLASPLAPRLSLRLQPGLKSASVFPSATSLL